MREKYNKVWAYNRQGEIRGCLYGRFYSINDAVMSVLRKQLNLYYFDMNYFAGWTFTIAPRDENKDKLNYRLTAKGRLVKK